MSPDLRVFTDRRCLAHAAPRGYPERPERLVAIVDGLRSAGWEIVDTGADGADRETAGEAVRAAVEAVHDPEYVARLGRAVERGDALFGSADNPLSTGTWEAAWAAVEATLAAADWVAGGSGPAAGGGEGPAASGGVGSTASGGVGSTASGGVGRIGFAAVRPPGHHAEHALAMGFCFFDNVAVAAEYLRRRHGFGRVAIFDFDVHHGNGTQHLFEDRADVFYASTHQYPFYPGTGAAGERGTGAGVGATLNVPLPAGTGDGGYRQALEEEILPALAAFRPDVLLVSAGFDAWRHDPLGGMQVTAPAFRDWGARLRAFADEHCDGRLLAVLEGGYDLDALPGLVQAHLEGLGSAP